MLLSAERTDVEQQPYSDLRSAHFKNLAVPIDIDPVTIGELAKENKATAFLKSADSMVCLWDAESG